MSKPKCGKGQSCGNSCISAKDTCKEKLDAATASKLIAITQQLSSIRDKAVKSFAPGDTDKTFEELEAKYQFTNATRGTSVEEKLDKGISLWHITMPASDTSGDTLSYSVLNAGGKSYTVSDGLIKEYTASDRNGLYKESIQAAIRAKVEQDSLAKAKPVAAEPQENVKPASIAPYKTESVLGSGAFGFVHRTDRGTVVKTMSVNGDDPDEPLPSAKELTGEYKALAVLHNLGIGPKPIGLDLDLFKIEMEEVRGLTAKDKLQQAGSPEERSRIADSMIRTAAVMHRAGYSHNDLHSQNVMIDESGSVKIIDASFLAKVGESTAYDDLSVNGFADLSRMLKSNALTSVPLAISTYSSLLDELDRNGSTEKYKESRELDGQTKSELYLHGQYLKALTKLGY